MTGKIEISVSDITVLDRDCIVNAANSGLQMGGGVCGAIFRAAGADKLQQACNAIGGCPTGSAVLTPGFRLKARYIAHAVGPIWWGGTQGEPQQLYSCYQSALTAAWDAGCRSIAFPLISSGIYGYPADQAWQVALKAVSDFLKAGNPMLVTFAVLNESARQKGALYLSKLEGME